MNILNPYLAAFVSGAVVYFYNYKGTAKGDKEKKQTNMNYVFFTSIVVFICMSLYSSNSSSLEPTLDTKFDD